MTKEVYVKFFKVADIWRFEIRYEKYNLAGCGESFEDAELKAYASLTGLPRHDTIHIDYSEGKAVKPVITKKKDALL